jgi:hypothetical protein
MARIARQTIPAPPDHYDQQYISRVVDALNKYMFQRSQGEIIAARFISTATPIVGPSPNLPDTKTLANGTIYLGPVIGASADPSTYYQAWATGTVTLTTTAQPIPGCSVTVARAGTFLVLVTYDFVSANEQGNSLFGGLTGTAHQAVVNVGNNTGRATVTQHAILQFTGNQLVQMTAYKGGGTGNSSTSTECSLSVLWIPGLPLPGSAGDQFLTVVKDTDV